MIPKLSQAFIQKGILGWENRLTFFNQELQTQCMICMSQAFTKAIEYKSDALKILLKGDVFGRL